MTNSINQSNYGYNPQAYNYSNKALGMSNLAADINHDGTVDQVEQWVASNTELYQKITNPQEFGASGLSGTDEAQFMEWWNWAQSEIQGGSSSWGDDGGMTPVDPNDPANGGYDVGQASDPFGGQPGSMNNLVYTDDKTRLGFIGETRPMDVWSSDVTLDVSSSAASVNVEKTSDTRFQPPEDVLKVTVKDSATGKISTYFLHNPEDITSLKINTPGAKHVTDATGVAKVGNYKKPSDVNTDAAPESNVAPEAQDDGTLVVEAPIGQTVELTPAGNGEDQTWEVYGNYNISTRPSDKVVVAKTGDDTYTIEVTHRNGEKDTYKIQAGSEGNINATPENVSFVDRSHPTNIHGVDVDAVDVGNVSVLDPGTGSSPVDPVKPEVKVPAGWEHLTLNGGAEDSTGEVVNGDQPTSMDGETRVYDGQDFNISPVSDGDKKTATVDASGTVTITPNSNSEYFSLSLQSGTPATYVLTVYKDAARTQVKETIKIDADLVDQLNLNIDPSRLQIADMSQAYKAKLKTEGGVAEGDIMPSADQISMNLPIYISTSDLMQQIVSLFDAAAKSGNPADWKKFMDKIDCDGDGDVARNLNDAIRSLVTALYKSVGSDDAKLGKVLDLIPVDVRKAMSDVFNHAADGLFNIDDEMDERKDGEIWNSQDTQSLIDNSMAD